METDALVARAGAVAAGAFVVLVAVPYAFIGASSIDLYYGVGVVGPQVLALFVAVLLVALLAAAAGRSDPATVAGIGVVLGLVVAAFALWWAIAAGEVVGGIPVDATFDYHRWALAGTGVLLALVTAVYAKRVV